MNKAKRHEWMVQTWIRSINTKMWVEVFLSSEYKEENKSRISDDKKSMHTHIDSDNI